MPSFIEIFIAQDIADAVHGAGNCNHPAAANHNPFNMCSIAFADLTRFSQDQADRLEALPIIIVDSENDDFDLIANLLDAISQVMTIDHNERNTILYTFAKAHRLGLGVLVKANCPHTHLCQDLANIFGVPIFIVQ